MKEFILILQNNIEKNAQMRANLLPVAADGDLGLSLGVKFPKAVTYLVVSGK